MGNNCSTIIDFDVASYGPFAEDIVYSLLASFVQLTDNHEFVFNVDLSKEFIVAYNQVRPIQPKGLKRLPLFLKEVFERNIIRNNKYAIAKVPKGRPKEDMEKVRIEIHNSIPAFRSMTRQLAHSFQYQQTK